MPISEEERIKKLITGQQSTSAPVGRESTFKTLPLEEQQVGGSISSPLEKYSTEGPLPIDMLKIMEEHPRTVAVANFLKDLGVWGSGAYAGGKVASLLTKAPNPWLKLLGAGLGAGAAYMTSEAASQATVPLKGEEEKPVTEDMPLNFALGAGFEWGGPLIGKVLRGSKTVQTAAGPEMRRTLMGKAEDLASKPLKWLRDKALETKWIPDSEKMLSNNREVSMPVKKSLSEVFQAAVERLDLPEQVAIRKPQIIKANISKLGQELGSELAQISNPKTRWEVMKGLRGATMQGMGDEAKTFLRNFSTKIGELTPEGKTVNDFTSRLGKLLNQSYSAPEDVFGSTSYIKDILKGVSTEASNLSKVSKVQKALVSMVESPNLTPELKALARDLHDLPVLLPEMVASASKDVTKGLMKDNLRAIPGVVLDNKPSVDLAKEYLPSLTFRHKGQSLWVKRDVELELRALDEIPKISRSWINKWMTSPWKTWKVIDRPAAWVRNGLSNLALNHISGLPFWRQDIYATALKDMAQGAKRYKNFAREAGTAGTFSVDDVFSMQEGMKMGSSMWDKLLSYHDKVQQPMRSLYNAEETLFKYSKYLHNLEKGMKGDAAVFDAIDATFNYGEVTRATAQIRSNFAPFFTWQVKAIPRVLNQVIKNPIRATGLYQLYQGAQDYAINKAGISEEEWEQLHSMLPEYVQSGQFFVLPWRDQNQRLQLLNLTYIIPGFGDLQELNGSIWDKVWGTPLFGLAKGLGSNAKFSGEPIWNEWDSAALKGRKQLGFIWETLTPSVLPGGTDFNSMLKMYDNIQGVEQGFEPGPKDPTVAQTLSGVGGLKILPVEEDETMRAFSAKIKIQLSDAKMSYLREAKKARSQEQMDEATQRYETSVQRIVSKYPGFQP